MIETFYTSYTTSYIEKGIEFQGKIYFSADDGNMGSELWRTDGTAAGTMLVGEISPTGGSFPSWYCVLNNKLLFEAYTDALDHELYKYEDPEFFFYLVKMTLRLLEFLLGFYM
jgi:ELWxxDGT repeat protein